jgi:hypothetical protein
MNKGENMKKRLCDLQAGLVITVALFLITVAETVVRAMQPDYLYAMTNKGETFAIAVFAAVILYFTFTKKERLSYICYGVLIGWFVLEEALSLPGALSSLSATISDFEVFAMVSNGAGASVVAHGILSILITIGIVAMGVLIAEYLHDGTIYNRTFNVFGLVTVLLLLISLLVGLHALLIGRTVELLLIVLNNLYRITMVFLFVFFAYDSAKAQLKKAKLET